MTRIHADKVTVDIPILSARARSLRTIAVAKARSIGGRIVDDGLHVPVVRALDGVCFELKEGDRLGLIGSNGAGKTTLIRVLADIYAPTAGHLTRQGTLVPMFDIGLGFDPEATGYENIALRGMIMGFSQKEIAAHTDAIASFSELGDYLDLPIRIYSAGMLLRLMFSIATCVTGDIILMDEWISVSDAAFRDKAHQHMLEVVGHAGILVMATHDWQTLTQHCTLGMRLEKGCVADFGPIKDVLERAK